MQAFCRYKVLQSYHIKTFMLFWLVKKRNLAVLELDELTVTRFVDDVTLSGAAVIFVYLYI